MNKIVREHYPAAKLPEDLREGLDPAADVRVIVEHAPSSEEELPLTRILDDMQEHRMLSGDPVARVRALRAEWDWREEFHDRIRAGGQD